MHLGRRPDEPIDSELRAFYLQLLSTLNAPIVRDGNWQLLGYRSAWDGNMTTAQFIVCAWQGNDGRRLLAAVNFGPTQGQCYVPLAWPEIGGRQVTLRDRLSDGCYERDGNDLQRGLYLDMRPWGYHVFDVSM
jgi:hypothetical protein